MATAEPGMTARDVVALAVVVMLALSLMLSAGNVLIVARQSGQVAAAQGDIRREAQRRAHASLVLRVEYCRALENLKAQNRADVARAKAQFPRNLHLLGLKNTPALRRAARADWNRTLRRNRARACPYRV